MPNIAELGPAATNVTFARHISLGSSGYGGIVGRVQGTKKHIYIQWIIWS